MSVVTARTAMLGISVVVSAFLVTLMRFEQSVIKKAPSLAQHSNLAMASSARPTSSAHPVAMQLEDLADLGLGGGGGGGKQVRGASTARAPALATTAAGAIPAPARRSLQSRSSLQPGQTPAPHASLKYSEEYEAAMLYIGERQTPKDCSKAMGIAASIGRGGGFGSMFQWSAKLFAAALATAHDKDEADRALSAHSGTYNMVTLKGNLKTYTHNEACRGFSSGRSGLDCFFEPVSRCNPSQQKRFNWPDRGDTAKSEYKSLTAGMESSIPTPLKSNGIGFWWGALQGYLSRLNPRMQARLAVVQEELGYYDLFTGRRPEIGMHIRLGDKQRDGQSKQSGVAGTAEDYFKQADALIARLREERCKQPGGGGEGGACTAPVGVYIATDSTSAVDKALAWADASKGSVRLVVASTKSQKVSSSGGEVAKLIAGEQRKEAYTIAEEVVLDLQLLLGTSYFVGLCMSQLARYVAGVGLARGTLKEAIAMDFKQINRADQFKLKGEHVPWSRPL